MKKHRYGSEFKVTAVKLANHPGIETQEAAAAETQAVSREMAWASPGSRLQERM
jgi:hypothetical protein